MKKIAVVGATGLVGSVMMKVLEEFGVTGVTLIPAASEKSVGKKVLFDGKEISVVSVDDAIAAMPDYALFSAGAGTSKKYAPLFAQVGCTVIDNSSCWRMDKNIPLVVPEINMSDVTSETKIIANPNCSTIQMVMALAPIYKNYGIKRLVISTYQSVSGSGVRGLAHLREEEMLDGSGLGSGLGSGFGSGLATAPFYPYPIHRNIIPQGGDFLGAHSLAVGDDSLDEGYTSEEEKLINETRKIFGNRNIRITATVTRVPASGGHSESVNVETEKPFDIPQVRNDLSRMNGVVVVDNPVGGDVVYGENKSSDVSKFRYPMPLYSEGSNEVFVGRIRRDNSVENGLNLWIVSDNIRKGAATNAVQILLRLIHA
ncbi:MAG: aspartate-semialdehyde dehydrogenase [Bacteroidales bacterium]|jgi:aspartate-semialdehyde dehydrogenase|nr:aspartate-semialdehyde dehydrogenase [Bacteroidales bacterium]